jgi:helix-turn-helix domain-containing protein|nr:helix-turn-helix transcriptional regulator [uncultured Cardiobacterium sp.]
MKTFEKIRKMREEKHWSQEEMAGKLNMSINGYAKIERGETRLNLPRLEQISEIFETDILDLIQTGGRGLSYQVGDNNSDIAFYATASHELAAEIARLKLIISHKDELLAQQARELATLQEMVALLKSRS